MTDAPLKSNQGTDRCGGSPARAAFDPSRYGPVAAALLAEVRRPPVGPGQPNGAARAMLEAATIDRLFAHAKVADPQMAEACRSGLWLYHDYLDESHTISQGIDDRTGSYWHGIMHRREPDYGNAAYWFRRVGEHPIFGQLLEDSRAIALRVGGITADTRWLLEDQDWDPFALINLCQACRRRPGQEHELCREICWAEWCLLFHYSYRMAVGER